MKLNIHMSLEDPALSWTVKENRKIREITDSIIDFSDLNVMKPHLTILMGTLQQGITCNALVEKIGNLLESTKPPSFVECQPGSYYLENIRNRYVFLDLTPSSEFVSLKELFVSELEDTFLLSEGGYSATPHITIAHIEGDRHCVENYISETPIPETCRMSEVSVALAGPKGSATRTIHSWLL